MFVRWPQCTITKGALAQGYFLCGCRIPDVQCHFTASGIKETGEHSQSWFCLRNKLPPHPPRSDRRPRQGMGKLRPTEFIVLSDNVPGNPCQEPWDPCVEIFNIGTQTWLVINCVCRRLAGSLTWRTVGLICALLFLPEGWWEHWKICFYTQQKTFTSS